MKYAIVSDIHANLEALMAVLADIDRRDVDRIVCLGDVVGYGPEPDECLSVLRRRGIFTVCGNHDAVAAGLAEPTDFSPGALAAIVWTQARISDESRLALCALPRVQVIDHDFVVVHGALHPWPNAEVRLRSEADARPSFDVLLRDYPDVHVAFFGHTHCPAVYAHRDSVMAMPARGTLRLDRSARYLINPGSVGQSRDEDERAAFALFDSAEMTVRFCRARYDRAAMRRKAVRVGLLKRTGILHRSAGWLRSGFRLGRAVILSKCRQS